MLRLLIISIGIVFCLSSLGLAQQQEFIGMYPPTTKSRVKKPTSSAIHPDGTIFIADPSSSAVFAFGEDGVLLKTIRSFMVGNQSKTLDKPIDIAFNLKGELYVLDEKEDCYYRFLNDSTATQHGFEGKDFGSLRSPKSITVDANNYVYIANPENHTVVLFSPQGDLQSWIQTTSNRFLKDPIAVDVSRNGTIYVLEKDENVHIYDPFLRWKNSFERTKLSMAVSLDEVTDIAVLGNGDFLLLDSKRSVVSQFDTTGTLVRSIGVEGRSGKGTFEEMIAVNTTLSLPNRLLITDAKASISQQFKLPFAKSEILDIPDDRRLLVKPVEPVLPPHKKMVTAGNGTRYLIPATSDQAIVGYDQKGTPSAPLRVSRATTIDADEVGNVFILDDKEKEVTMYDSKGVLIRKMGQESNNRLRKPIDITVQSDGTLFVLDADDNTIRKWNNQGVYEGNLLTTQTSILQEPIRIDTDPNNLVYVHDAKLNALLRFDADGKPLDYFRLTLRSDKEGETGKITDFFLDMQGLIHIFNGTTNQYEVWKWDSEPLSLLSFGKEGTSLGFFRDVTSLNYDAVTSTAYFVIKGGKDLKATEITLIPPSVPTPLEVHIKEKGYELSFDAVNSIAIQGYRLKNESDSVFFSSEDVPFSIPSFYSKSSPELKKLYLISYSVNAESKNPVEFVDYIGYADYLFANNQQAEAFDFYTNGIELYGNDTESKKIVALRYADLGKKLADRYELSAAMTYLTQAYELYPEGSELLQALGYGYSKEFEKLSTEKNYDELLVKIQHVFDLGDPSISTQAEKTLIQITEPLVRSTSATSLSYALKIYTTLYSLNPDNVNALLGKAQSSYGLYKAKKISGAPSFELSVQLAESEKIALSAKESIDKENPSYHELSLLLQEIQLENEKFDPVISSSLDELRLAGMGLDKELEINYRLNLATAYLETDQIDLAVLEYQRVLTYDSKKPEYLTLYAQAQIKNKSYDEAISVYQSLLMNDQQNARHIGEIGKIYLLMGNFQEASFQLEKALKLDPTLNDLYGPLAKSFDGSSQYQQAIGNYQIAIRLKEEEYKSARNQMVGSSIVSALQKELVSYQNSLATIYLQTGNYEQAVQTFNSVLSFNASNISAWQGLGEAYMSSGQIYKAIDAYNTALKLDQTNETIASALSNARSVREEMSKNRPPVEIISIDISPVFPSLTKNYTDATKLPLGSVILANNTRLPFNNIEMTLHVPELMQSPTPQQMKTLLSFSNTSINLAAVFSDSIMNLSNDKTYTGLVTLKYTFDGEEKVVEKSTNFTIRSRNAIVWSDKRRLASFIDPSSEKLVDFVKEVQVLFRDAPTYGLNGNILKAAALYSVYTNSGFTYSPDPEGGYQTTSTKTDVLDFMQYPTETILRKSGDCDDFVALLCGSLEAAGIQTAYVDVPGHVFMTFDSGILPEELPYSGLKEEDVIVLYEKVWIPIETTLLGTQSFMTAWKEGAKRYYSEQEKGNFPEVVPLQDARNVYTPISYVPSDFEPTFPETSILIEQQTQFVRQVFAQSNDRKINQFEERLQTEPKNIYLRNQLGMLYAKTGATDKAEEIYKASLEIAPESALLHNNYGNILSLKGKSREAFDAYIAALEIDDTDPEIYINLCKSQLALGDKSNAQKSFAKAVEMNPELNDLYEYLNEELH